MMHHLYIASRVHQSLLKAQILRIYLLFTICQGCYLEYVFEEERVSAL